MMFVLYLFILLELLNKGYASLGDSFPYYKSCVSECKSNKCDHDGYHLKDETGWSILRFMEWRCSDDCQYNCMWTIVESFQRKGWPPPQFHGKWPFARWLGIQEPASVLFSLLNLIVHIVMFRRFREEVRTDSPMFKVWAVYAAVCVNGWIWSAIFHSRDLYFTEIMDYLSAFSMVFYTFYGMGMRLLVRSPAFFSFLFSVLCAMLFFNHALYLTLDVFDYHYNMAANIITARWFYGGGAASRWVVTCSVISKAPSFLGLQAGRWEARECSWFAYLLVFTPGALAAMVTGVWCGVEWRLPQAKLLSIVVVIGALSTLLEVLDFPPYAWTLDAHALWHLSTAPAPYFFWRFAIEDCKYLRKNYVAFK